MLNGHIQGGCGFIGDQQGRLRNQHHGDHDALTHAARHFVGIETIHLFRISDVNRLQHFQRFTDRRFSGYPVMRPIRFGNLAADCPDRIQGVARVLHDHGDPFAPNRPHLFFTQVQQILSVESQRVCGNTGG